MSQPKNLVVGSLTFDRQGAPCLVPLPKPELELPARMQLRSAPSDLPSGVYILARLQTLHGVVHAHFDRMLGSADEPYVEALVAEFHHSIPSQWPDDALTQTAALSDQISVKPDTAECNLSRADLRDLPFFTIDGADSRDHDDAVYCRPHPDGGWYLWVAIADVSHYVRAGSPLDQAALERGCSVYFPSRVQPMLPERLSTDLCSLKPAVDRFCLVCEMVVSDAGQCSDYRFYQAVMHSNARLTYSGVDAVLFADGADNGQVHQSASGAHENLRSELTDLYDLYKALRGVRENRGALDVETPASEFIFNKKNKLIDIKSQSRGQAHRIIEECMIIANTCAAEFLSKEDVLGLYRVHEMPERSNHVELAKFLQILGIHLPLRGAPQPSDYQRAIERINLRPDGALLSLQVLRAMDRAVYSTEDLGHFGLALETYTHFTSPIRRYADLLVHRAIKVVLAKNAETTKEYNHTKAQLEQIASDINVASQRTDNASRFAENWLRCALMQKRTGDVFTGTIVGVKEFGIFVEVARPYIQGMVHISALGQDYFNYDVRRMHLIGRRSGKTFSLGDSLRVKLVQVEQDKGRLTFMPADVETDRPQPPRRSAKKRKRRR